MADKIPCEFCLRDATCVDTAGIPWCNECCPHDGRGGLACRPLDERDAVDELGRMHRLGESA